MSQIVLEVENLSKLYRLGTIGTGSLRQDMKHWWMKKALKKESSFFNATGGDFTPKTHLWALDNVNFTVKKGDTLGIIGSNGAGKSTLLKIISRIVQPTKGMVKGIGRVGSLLEIGTGFNPDLTGRENIFISGYLLGMKKHEIKSKFDEIIDFSGIERFIDTPVKRYSSGMYVRLAFAVAAHLEPDILIVDEVLAVGDADFQKKCLGKMKEVSSAEGRTILFVSHNLQAIANLCKQAMWLQHGKLVETGNAPSIVTRYISNFKQDKVEQSWLQPENAPGNDLIRLKSIEVKPQPQDINSFITVKTPVRLDFEFWCFLENCNVNINVILHTENGECVFNIGSPSVEARKGILALSSIIPDNLLNNSTYLISLTIIKNNSFFIHEFSNCTAFEVEDVRENMYYFGSWPGIIRPHIISYLSIKENDLFEPDGSLNKGGKIIV
jgi:lipopolysaccharide transport system ATP-binding protein